MNEMNLANHEHMRGEHALHVLRFIHLADWAHLDHPLRQDETAYRGGDN